MIFWETNVYPSAILYIYVSPLDVGTLEKFTYYFSSLVPKDTEKPNEKNIYVSVNTIHTILRNYK